MPQAFIIMQIGNPELDRLYERALVPAIEACGLTPRRVDRHTRGGLLASEIISFIEESEILVADLTNERPNCYLEVGYALGLGKFTNLILTAREDHDPESPRHRTGGPRVHFDLAGYDILFWRADRLAALRQELEKRIQRRMLMLGAAS
jgi:predicted metal-dependent phosphotriesterase family hydrolase